MAEPLLYDIKEFDVEPVRLRQELGVVAELSRKEIHKSAHSLESQEETNSSGYLRRYELAKERIEALEKDRTDRIAKSKTIKQFIRSIQGTSDFITELDEALWTAIVDSVLVKKDDGMVFRFMNGTEVTIQTENNA